MRTHRSTYSCAASFNLEKQTMKSLTLISFTTFFILLVITSSLAGGEEDEDNDKGKHKDKGKETSTAADVVEGMPPTVIAVIAVAVLILGLLSIFFCCLCIPKCLLHHHKDPCLECICKPCNKSGGLSDNDIEGVSHRQTMKTGMGGFTA